LSKIIDFNSKIEKEVEQEESTSKAELLQLLDGVRQNVENGDVTSLCIAGTSKSGHLVGVSLTTKDAVALVGVLRLLEADIIGSMYDE
jgi:hypothetical protein